MGNYSDGYSFNRKELEKWPKCPKCKFHVRYKRKKELHVHLTRCNLIR